MLVDSISNNRFTSLRDYVCSYNSGIDVLSAPKDPRDVSKIESKYISKILDIAKKEYDIVLVDTHHLLDEMTLVVLRDDKEIEKKLTVAEYLTSSVGYELLYNDIGYVSISEFDNNTGKDFKEAVEKLVSQGATQFVFDVRNNTGGSLTTVVEVLDYLLPEGTLVTLKDNAGQENVYTSDKNSFNKKYTVLINESTYSGGELFAAAIRDFKTATLVGKTTYGKGYAQEIIPLSKGALYLSTKLYYPPSGENYEGVGVAPDKEVELTPELEERFYELSTEEDLQLVAALEELGKTIKKTEEPEQTEQEDE